MRPLWLKAGIAATLMAALVIAAVLIPAISRRTRQDLNAGSPFAASPRIRTSISGEVVTVSAEVGEWLLPTRRSGYAFVVGDSIDEPVLVVPTRPDIVPRGIDADDIVRVTGRVGRLSPDRDAGADLLGEGGILERYAGRPSIRASRVEVL